MRKGLYIIGFAGWLLVSTGALLDKLMQQGMGEPAGSIGSVLLLIFIPRLVFDIYKLTGHHTLPERLTIVSAVSGLCLGGLGLAVRALHLPGAFYFIATAITLLFLILPPLVIWSMYKRSEPD